MHIIVNALCTTYFTTSHINNRSKLVKFFKMFKNISHWPLKHTSEWNKISKCHLMVAFASKLELQGLFWRSFYSQRTRVTNFTFLAPIQLEIHALNSSDFVCLLVLTRLCRRREKNNNFHKCHGELLVIIYLIICLHTK